MLHNLFAKVPRKDQDIIRLLTEYPLRRNYWNPAPGKPLPLFVWIEVGNIRDFFNRQPTVIKECVSFNRGTITGNTAPIGMSRSEKIAKAVTNVVDLH